jgi:hypothetical protein
MASEQNMAADGVEVGADPNLAETFPRVVVMGGHNGFPRLRALIVVTACMELPSSVVRFH